MKLRNGKIAYLPANIREQLNLRLSINTSGPVLLKWLNALPEVQAVLALYFDGRPLNKQNLSEWRHGGYAEWFAEYQSQPSLMERDPEFQRLFCSLLRARLKETFVQLMRETVIAALACLEANRATNQIQTENGLAQANSSNN